MRERERTTLRNFVVVDDCLAAFSHSSSRSVEEYCTLYTAVCGARLVVVILFTVFCLLLAGAAAIAIRRIRFEVLRTPHSVQ